MATVKKGVWDLQQVRDQVLEGAWDYASSTDPGELYLWGLNTSGQMGLNVVTSGYSSPIQLPGTEWTQSVGGYDGIRALKSDGTLWAWGYNYYGGLGQNDTANRSSPIQVPGTQWNYIARTLQNSNATLATKTDGTLWAWGYNNHGTLGQNDRANQSSPVQVPGTQWDGSTLSSGGGMVMCKKTDNGLWVWGSNNYGQLGVNTYNVFLSSPTQLPGTDWAAVLASPFTYGPMATKTDGTLWSWGNNAHGQLGHNNATSAHRSSPTQIPGTQWSTSVDSIGGSTYVGLAIKTDGTLWAWGYNNNGTVGDNNRVPRSSPVQIPGTQWKKVDGGYNYHVNALKTDDTLWAWGYNAYGQLGQNNTAARSSPVQVPGTQWSRISSGSYYSTAIKNI